MSVDIDKMREAMDLVKRVDTLLSDAGVYDAGIDTAASMQSLYEDLEMDIARAADGLLDD